MNTCASKIYSFIESFWGNCPPMIFRRIMLSKLLAEEKMKEAAKAKVHSK